MKIVTARPRRLLEEMIQRIGALAMQGEPCMLIVPSQFTLQAEIEIMTRLEISGSFLIDVLSPSRLKGRIFERAGEPEQVVFDERGKCMVLSAVLDEEKENLSVYRAAAGGGGMGLAQKMSALIADIKRSEILPSALMESAQALEEDHPARGKLMDVARIYAAYESKMKGRLCDGEDVAVIVREKMGRSGVLDGRHVFVYGFDMITPAFAADLAAISAHAASLTLFIETDRNSAPDGRLFAPVNASIERLCALCAQRGIEAKIERLTAPMHAAKDLCLLESGLFALGQKPHNHLPDGVTLTMASNPRAEVHIAASKIRGMLSGGEDPAQVAVVYPKTGEYGALIEGIFPMYDLPVYTAGKRAAKGHPLCRFVLSALAAASDGMRTGDVIECVQSGFLGLTREQADALCSYAEGEDVRTDGWKHPFTYIRSGDEETLRALNAAREIVVPPLIALGKALSAARTADETVAAVMALLDETNAADTLEQMRGALLKAGFDALAQDCAQVWNHLMETLDQLHTLLGGESVCAGTALRLLESGLSSMELAALPPADGAIICGEIGNVRTAQVRTLFALGMNDEGASPDQGLLTPGEAEEAARATGAYLGMSASERTALSQLDTLKAWACASEALIVSFSVADETGRALREGSAVLALRRLFPKLPCQGRLPGEEAQDMLCAPKAAPLALSVMLSDAADGKSELSPAAGAAYAALAQREEGREALLLVTRSLGERHRAPLDGAQARALYGRPVMSVSRLETFAQCPYRHFVRYGLTPQEEAKPGVDRAQVGTIYHEAAEAFTKAITGLPEFPHVPPEVCDRVMTQAIAPLIEKWRESPLGRSARGASIAGRIEKTARRAGRNIVSQFAQSEFSPVQSEFVFGKQGMAPIVLEIADGTMIYLQGRIDRVDVMDGGKIRVVDYKSGTKKFEPTLVYWGLQLQLLIYLAAALAQIPGSQAAGFFYCRIADPTIRSESRVKEEIEKQIAKKLSLAGISLSDVRVLRAQDAAHAAMITREGGINGRYSGKMVDEAGMERLVSFAKRRAAQIAAGAYAGVIEDSPAERGQYVACASCEYAAVCGFDPTRQKRRRLSEKRIEDLV